MIPKKIHYCWLSNDKMSKVTNKCMDTWRKVLPDYEFILWNTKNFDINSVPFVKQAYDMKKYASASDYIRLYAVYNEGGIYLDTDVYIKKSFNDLLNYDFFSSLERDLTTVPIDSEYALNFMKNENPDFINKKIERIEGFGLQAAIFGAKPNNVFIKDCMEWYENNNFTSTYTITNVNIGVIAPDVYAAMLQKYGFRYISGIQQLINNMIILPADYFPNHIYKTDNAYAVHICENSWSKNKNKCLIKKTIELIKKNNLIRKLFKKKKYYSWENIINIGGQYKI